jgi:hypothetical protein
VEALGSVGDPESGPLDIAEGAPGPTLSGPILGLVVPAGLDEAQELAVGHLKGGGESQRWVGGKYNR